MLSEAQGYGMVIAVDAASMWCQFGLFWKALLISLAYSSERYPAHVLETDRHDGKSNYEDENNATDGDLLHCLCFDSGG